MKINQKVTWKNRHGIQTGKIVKLYLGDLVGSANKYPGLRQQRIANIKLTTGETVTVDRGYLKEVT